MDGFQVSYIGKTTVTTHIQALCVHIPVLLGEYLGDEGLGHVVDMLLRNLQSGTHLDINLASAVAGFSTRCW